MKIAPETFRQKPLHVHAFLSDVPLHDVWEFRLRGGGSDKVLADFRRLWSSEGLKRVNPLVRALFWLRRVLGQVFGWDKSPPGLPANSYVHRLSEADRARSLDPPGSDSLGPFHTVYRFEQEILEEAINATVHALSLMTFEPAGDGDGYTALWAIYVKPIGRITPLYMAIIEPFRRWLVYPSIIKRIEAAWADASAASLEIPAAAAPAVHPD